MKMRTITKRHYRQVKDQLTHPRTYSDFRRSVLEYVLTTLGLKKSKVYINPRRKYFSYRTDLKHYMNLMNPNKPTMEIPYVDSTTGKEGIYHSGFVACTIAKEQPK